MTAAEKVHNWMLKFKIINGVLPNSEEIIAQLEMAIEEENKMEEVVELKKEKNNTSSKLTKVSMNLNERSLENVNKLSNLIGEKNKTKVIAIVLELSRNFMEISKENNKKLKS